VTVIAPVKDDVARALTREKLLVRLAGIFGALAVTLAAIGLYGLLAYEVADRMREIGIRMALGAPRDHVLRTEVGSALRRTAIGIGFGIRNSDLDTVIPTPGVVLTRCEGSPWHRQQRHGEQAQHSQETPLP
jgi:FtsX-like permease family protein